MDEIGTKYLKNEREQIRAYVYGIFISLSIMAIFSSLVLTLLFETDIATILPFIAGLLVSFFYHFYNYHKAGIPLIPEKDHIASSVQIKIKAKAYTLGFDTSFWVSIFIFIVFPYSVAYIFFAVWVIPTVIVNFMLIKWWLFSTNGYDINKPINKKQLAKKTAIASLGFGGFMTLFFTVGGIFFGNFELSLYYLTALLVMFIAVSAFWGIFFYIIMILLEKRAFKKFNSKK